MSADTVLRVARLMGGPVAVFVGRARLLTFHATIQAERVKSAQDSMPERFVGVYTEDADRAQIAEDIAAVEAGLKKCASRLR